VVQKEQSSQFKILLGLVAIWLATALCDRLWFSLDQSVPAWDQADYLTGSLNYWQALQHPQWLSGQWWDSFWQLSSKIPPLTYIATAMSQQVFGRGLDQATLVLLLFNAVILGSVYGLGVQLFNSRVGLWAAGLTILLPGLYRYRLEFLLDYPLTAVVTLSFCCLTVWRNKAFAAALQVQKRNQQLITLIWGIVFGISLGLALMVKQTALLFLLTPILWTIIGIIRRRYWGNLAQLIGGLLVSVLVFGPWYRINWLLILTSGKRATIDSAIAEGDPALNTIDAWIYYWKILPYLISWPLLLVPLVGLLLYVVKNYPRKIKQKNSTVFASISWLAVFLVGGYLLCSLNVNKDARYILPLLPVLSLLLAYCLTQWSGRWAKTIRWGTVSLAMVLMLLNLFPLRGGFFTQILSPRVQHVPYLGPEWPHPLVIAEISQTSPYLRTTLGVLPSTPQINQHNLNYYGALKDFQVYGRQVGTQAKQVSQDVRSLSWFLTKTGDQGSVPEAQVTTVQAVEQSSDFQLQKTWNLPDESTLKLYHRSQPPIQVQPVPELSQSSLSKIQLEQVRVPETAPPGLPVPVTYQWLGPWEQLQAGIVILTWQPIAGQAQHQWLHDHGIAMGELHSPQGLQVDKSGFRVIERTAMLPPADLPTGTYTLKATYLNRQTGETYPLAVPTVRLQINPVAPAIPAPELDLITQLRTLSANLPQGPKALEPVFEETGRINQYDPIQDYLVQATLALQYRLKLAPQNLKLAYALTFSQVLQEDAEGAIAALQKVTQLDAQNPYAHAYLAFVYLYNWQPRYAEEALKPALALNPNIPEVQALSGVAALLQGKLFQAWQVLIKLNL